jgi:hypothetical protein
MVWNTNVSLIKKKQDTNIKERKDYIDCKCDTQSVVSGKSESWLASTAQLVNHVTAWNSSFVIPKSKKNFLSTRSQKKLASNQKLSKRGLYI